MTGGLGPTSDDVTREITAELLGRELAPDPDLAHTITQRLPRRGIRMTDRILRQAEVPRGAVVLPNDNGTAPGLYLAAEATPPRIYFSFRVRRVSCSRCLGNPSCRFFSESSGWNRLSPIGAIGLSGWGNPMSKKRSGRNCSPSPDLELGYCARMGEVDLRLIGSAEATPARGRHRPDEIGDLHFLHHE